MIIFDTNAVNLLSPDSPRADIIRKLRQSGHHRVAVPWMVLEEMAAHKARYYPDKHQAVVNALAKLRADLPWELQSSLEPLQLERLLEHWRKIYGEIFEVIETSDAVMRRAYQREAMALPPTKRVDDHSEGGRDAAIWFSVLEFLRQNPDEHVHFVTNNSKDFGDGTTFRYPMDEDVRGLEDRLTYLKDFNEVVSQFTKEVSGEDAQSAAAELLRSPSVQEQVARTAKGLSSLTGFAGLNDGGATEEWYAWLFQPEVQLLSIEDVTGHEIEGDTWYTADAHWLLYGPAVDEVEASAGPVACIWQLKILFSTRREEETVTLLPAGEPALPDTGDAEVMTAWQRMKERVAQITRQVSARSLAAKAQVTRRRAQQASNSLAGLDAASLVSPSLTEVAAQLNRDLTGGLSVRLRDLMPDLTDSLAAGSLTAHLQDVMPDFAPGIVTDGLTAHLQDLMPDLTSSLAAGSLAHLQDIAPDISPALPPAQITDAAEAPVPTADGLEDGTEESHTLDENDADPSADRPDAD